MFVNLYTLCYIVQCLAGMKRQLLWVCRGLRSSGVVGHSRLEH